MLDAERERASHAVAARDAHFAEWRDAASSAGQLSPALLANFAGALAALTSECEKARIQLLRQQTEFDACRTRFKQGDRLAELASKHVADAKGRHRRALDERRMAELDIRSACSTEDR
ncbi:hypothetical protein [Burkholderia sp. PU8-34]